MELLWQNIVVGLAILGAIGYLVGHWRRKRRRQTGCPACPAYKAVTTPRPPQGPPRRPSTSDH